MRPRVLAVTSELPWPLDSGGRLRTFHVQRALNRGCDVRLVVPVRPEQAPHVEALKDQGFHLVPVAVPPRTKLGEARRVMKSFLRSEPYVMYGRHDRAEVRSAFEDQLKQPTDVVWLDHIDSLHFKPSGVKSIIDLHNIYSLILERMSLGSTFPKQQLLHFEARRLGKMEMAAAKCDAIVAVSNSEAEYFRAFGANTIVAPNGVDVDAFADLPTGRMDAAPKVMFLGTLNWGPNVSAALHLAKEIFPKVRAQMPEAELVLVGKDPSPEIRALKDVTVTGSVPSVLPYLRDSAVLAVPLDAGGGTRLKILEAFAAGLPVISTAVGMEGIDAVDGTHFLRAERADMATAIVRLLDDRAYGCLLASQARSLAISTYHWGPIGDRCVELVRKVVNG